jgi:predicted NUDIX family NTP pyrophosphohydrolase
MDRSAGCIIIKHFNGVPHVLLAHAAGNWRSKLMGFPKGHVDEGEDLKKTAIREVQEEVGVTATILDKLGEVKTKRGKQVTAFVALYKSGRLDGKKALDLQKEEVDWAKFYPIDQAIDMVYSYQKPLFQKAKAYIEKEAL